MPARGFGLIVVDVSFISLTLVMPSLGTLTAVDGHLLALVKPQFEVGRDALDGRGIVRSAELFEGYATRSPPARANAAGSRFTGLSRRSAAATAIQNFYSRRTRNRPARNTA